MNVVWIGALIALLAASMQGGWSRAGAWLSLALLGQAASQGLYEAGRAVGYHHYRFALDLERGVWLLALVAQAVLVLWGLRAAGIGLRGWFARNLPRWRTGAALALLLITSAKVAYPASHALIEFPFAFAVELVALGNLVLAVVAIPSDLLGRLDARLTGWLGAETPVGVPEPGGLDRFAWTCAGFATVSAALLCVFVYQAHPHIPDEVVYLIQARTLAAGHLTSPMPPFPEGFDIDLMLAQGERWISPMPHGYPLLLALGVLVGLPWIVNPLLGGLGVLVTYLFLREVTDRRSARMGIALLACSTWFLFLNMSFMSHSWSHVCAMVAGYGVARSRRSGHPGWAWLAGAAVGMVSLTRPLEGVVLAGVLGLWALGLGGARLRWPSIAGLVLGTAIVGATVFPYNEHMTGDPLRHPVMVYFDEVYGPGINDLGFGKDKGLVWGGLDPFPGHDPFQALINAQFNTFAIDADLFGWSTGSLVFVLFLLFGARKTRLDRVMLALVAAVVGANSLYWFSGGPDFGARYWYLVLLPLIVMSVNGIRALELRHPEPARVRALVLALVALALVTFVPWRCADKYWHYRRMDPGILALNREVDFGRSLVLVSGLRHPDYASAAYYNDFLDWDPDGTVYAWDRSPLVRARLRDLYADRPTWVVEGPSVTGGGYRVIEGPYPPLAPREE